MINEYLKWIYDAGIDVSIALLLIQICVFIAVFTIGIFTFNSKGGLLTAVILFGISALLVMGYQDRYINKTTINKKTIVVENIDNKLLDINGTLVNENYVDVTPLKDTTYIKNAKESKLVLEEVTYYMKPLWIYSSNKIDMVNNTTKYFLKEVHQK